MQRLGIIGAGAWGTAIAATARRAGREVVIWARDQAVADTINRQHANPLYLPDVTLDTAIRATNDLPEAVDADAVFLAVPAQFLRAVSAALAPYMAADCPAVVCAKGVEGKTGKLMSEVLAETLPGRPVAILSGPTFAAEVARGLPTAVTLAAATPELGTALVDAVGTPSFRPYRAEDVIGAQIGGAIKNVLAIACGIADGRGFGDNARAALITRGLAEMTRLCRAKGGAAETMMGLSGLGDLTLTCNSMQSRNFSLGRALGEGQTIAEIQAARRSVAEGVYTAGPAAALAGTLGVDMPIAAAVDAILNGGAPVDEAIRAVLARPFRDEGE